MSGPEGRRVSIIGVGKVGSALASVLPSKGYRVVAVHDTDARALRRAAGLSGARRAVDAVDAIREAEVVFITTPDGAVEETCREIAGAATELAGRTFVHMSGALSLAALSAAAERGAGVLSIHPIQTFADVEGAVRSLPGSAFGVTCSPDLEPWAREFVHRLGGRMLEVRDADKVLYHAAAVIASNFLAMIEHAAVAVNRELGLTDAEAMEALEPLVRGTVDNISRLGPVRALTGPLARGDVDTIASHLEYLERLDPRLERLYRCVSLWGLALVEELGELDERRIGEMRSVLEGG